MAIFLFMACLLTGAVDIPASQIISTLFGGNTGNPVYETIIMESRLPMALTAVFCGMSLSLSGLMLQTTFSNPLAGPSILGVSTGASLGVALIIMGTAEGFLSSVGLGTHFTAMAGALLGASVIIFILISLSSAVKSATMLLIAGIMISYLASALISWLNFFAPAQEVKGFAVWGMGSFMGVTIRDLPLFGLLTFALCVGSIFLCKPLNALLSGDNYAASLGYNPRQTRTLILLYSGLLTSIATAYCGPVGFIGLAVPHIARVAWGTSNHNILMPATILSGATVGLLCALLSVMPSSIGILPLSAVTPLIGIPVILYVILMRKKLYYFN
ncbi:MAG: iron ABC transporter permease [Prevotella sp.]|nr:iron ABC transporter permease [Prevotella sp.]MCM1074720.1 iron ABC transporter permease [Ruminococcus sp.]